MAALGANLSLASPDVAAASAQAFVRLCPQQTSTEESLGKESHETVIYLIFNILLRLLI